MASFTAQPLPLIKVSRDNMNITVRASKKDVKTISSQNF